MITSGGNRNPLNADPPRSTGGRERRRRITGALLDAADPTTQQCLDKIRALMDEGAEK
jgi:hypothetical protein